ncbi:MAG: hypothetical protein IT168_01700 [Bryobacterales bacterium]|nr:hypothetical protein [Bryobacterales bacterium]
MKAAHSILAALPLHPHTRISVVYGDNLRGAGGEVYAITDVRKRRIVMDRELRSVPDEFKRILIHELFHFAWPRLGNRRRREWENLLLRELEVGARGELGWSAGWRKARLTGDDWLNRSLRWRDYACESFCDTAAWMFAEIPEHEEFTLSGRHQERRRKWFNGIGDEGFSV